MSQPDFQPTLIGPAVIVRPVQAEDWAELFEAGSDPELWKPYSCADRDGELRDYFNSAVASKMAFVFVDRATGRLIGPSRYYGYDAEKSEVEIGLDVYCQQSLGRGQAVDARSRLYLRRHRHLLGRR